MEIRNPNKTHLPQVLELLGCCLDPAPSAERLSRLLFYDENYDPNHVWMAREGGKVLGFLHTVQRGEKAWLKLLAVDPSARRRGIARDLLSRAEYRLSGEGAKQLWVESTPPHELFGGVTPDSAAAGFFASQGFLAAEAENEVWVPALKSSTPPPGLDLNAALAFAREACGEQFPWAEEQLACRPARAVFDPAVGLCLFEPGSYVGPLWLATAAEDQALKDLAHSALAAASLGTDRLRCWKLPDSAPWPLDGATYASRLTFFKAL